MSTGTHQHPGLNGARRRDPARIWGIRVRLVREFRRRFAALNAVIYASIVDLDCFGIQDQQPATLALARNDDRAFRIIRPTDRRQFKFENDLEKVKKFMAWLRQQERAGILEITTRPGARASSVAEWSDLYVQSYYQKSMREAYEKGLRKARSELLKSGKRVASLEQQGPIFFQMQQPIHVERLGNIYTRTFEDLKTVLDLANDKIKQQVTAGLRQGLTRGIAEGKNPRAIARELVGDVARHVNTIGLNRATLIARTEVVRAHHKATMAEYRLADSAMSVEVDAELLTSGLDNVCDECEELATGGPYTLDEAEDLIPVHPQ